MNTENSKLDELINTIHSFSSVRRYSNKTLIKEENIAEHSSIVGIISLFLFEHLSDDQKKLVDIHKLISYAVFHDFDEIFSGDILNPVKYHNDDILNGVNSYTEECISVFVKKSGMTYLEKFLSKDYLNDLEKLLSKLSDIISVFIKINIENGLGNKLLDIDYKNVCGVLKSEKYSDLLKLNPELNALCDSIIQYSELNHNTISRLNHSNIMGSVIK